jgi:hypothetical protein
MLLTSGASLAGAQPVIPPSELPGHERDRFIDSPVERFMKPTPRVRSPTVDAPRRGRIIVKPKKKPRRKP